MRFFVIFILFFFFYIKLTLHLQHDTNDARYKPFRDVDSFEWKYFWQNRLVAENYSQLVNKPR